MDEQEFKRRTMGLGLGVIAWSREIPRDAANDVLVRQLIRSGTSVGANYRAACRARSDSEMLAKLAIVEQEADESAYWLEMLVQAGSVTSDRAEPLASEATEILKMTVASIRTIRERIARRGGRSQVPARRVPSNPKSEIRDPK